MSTNADEVLTRIDVREVADDPDAPAVLYGRDVVDVPTRVTFEARYPGRCHECYGDIEPGDDIGYVDDRVCCAECVLMWGDE